MTIFVKAAQALMMEMLKEMGLDSTKLAAFDEALNQFRIDSMDKTNVVNLGALIKQQHQFDEGLQNTISLGLTNFYYHLDKLFTTSALPFSKSFDTSEESSARDDSSTTASLPTHEQPPPFSLLDLSDGDDDFKKLCLNAAKYFGKPFFHSSGYTSLVSKAVFGEQTKSCREAKEKMLLEQLLRCYRQSDRDVAGAIEDILSRNTRICQQHASTFYRPSPGDLEGVIGSTTLVHSRARASTLRR